MDSHRVFSPGWCALPRPAYFRWGQVYLLEALAQYAPVDSQEAETIAERVAPRLMHANSAVALAAIRVR